MAPREPQPRPLPTAPKPPIIPPDPPPDPPDVAPPPSTKPAEPTKRGRRDKTRESHPDFGDVRHLPPRPDPPIITGRRSRDNFVHSVGSAAWGGYDLLHIHDR
jgi:hypothetical protein